MENKIDNIIRGVDARATQGLKTIGVGKMGYSPIPVPYPKSALEYTETHWVEPTKLAKASDPDRFFLLPTDPRISVSGSNSVVMRELAGTSIRGTVKELWRHDDWQIKISGILMSDDNADVETYHKELCDIVNASENIIIENDTINNVYGITRIVVTAMTFDATDGSENQLFTITAVSDDSYNLEVE